MYITDVRLIENKIGIDAWLVIRSIIEIKCKDMLIFFLTLL